VKFAIGSEEFVLLGRLAGDRGEIHIRVHERR
jgi:hypothetical protein